MSQDNPHDHISKKRVVYTMPGIDSVTVRRDEVYRATDSEPLTMDLYYPPGRDSGTQTGAVIFVTGFSDVGAKRMLGCAQKEMGSYVAWAQLAAASGVVAVTYTNQDPATDVNAVIQHVKQNATSLAVDKDRIGLWACSGSVPVALSMLMQNADDCLKCAVLCYGYMLDASGSTGVADAAREFRFANPSAGRSVGDLRRDIPLFIARAGQDQMPGLNDALDRFLGKAVTRNLPVTFVNHALAPHAFDLFDDTPPSHDIIKRILSFLQFHLLRL
jgi:acetyl esterase/lipase